MKNKWLLLPLIGFVLVFTLFKCVFYIGYVPSHSMESTIMAGDVIIGIRFWNELDVGDIIVFEHDGANMVKRIAAVHREKITINGTTYTVPQYEYFVVGDNEDNSYDSRFWTEPFVKECDIKAKIFILQ